MRLKLPAVSNAADYHLHFGDDVWLQAAAAICARHSLPHTSIRRSPQGENIIFFVGETLVIKIFAPFRENYPRETTALAFARS
jgi:hypothetical protein